MVSVICFIKLLTGREHETVRTVFYDAIDLITNRLGKCYVAFGSYKFGCGM